MRTQSKTRENRAQDKVVIALKLKLIGWERGEIFFKINRKVKRSKTETKLDFFRRLHKNF